MSVDDRSGLRWRLMCWTWRKVSVDRRRRIAKQIASQAMHDYVLTGDREAPTKARNLLMDLNGSVAYHSRRRHWSPSRARRAA